MPEISRFLGIVIGIFPREHPPPHFHAVYGEYQITVEIETGVVHGDFPKQADLQKQSNHWSREMIPKLIEARYVRDFIIHIRFSDGTEGDIDFKNELHGQIFESLKDKEFFRQFTIHPVFHTLCWPNGTDFALEFLYDKVRIPA
ncbi:MAG: DUF2442 domain-containing protein [Spirochaetales bacterium]|nr:DUF2442 domain-containing protein [Spirochaetales bacterium]